MPSISPSIGTSPYRHSASPKVNRTSPLKNTYLGVSVSGAAESEESDSGDSMSEMENRGMDVGVSSPPFLQSRGRVDRGKVYAPYTFMNKRIEECAITDTSDDDIGPLHLPPGSRLLQQSSLSPSQVGGASRRAPYAAQNTAHGYDHEPLQSDTPSLISGTCKTVLVGFAPSVVKISLADISISLSLTPHVGDTASSTEDTSSPTSEQEIAVHIPGVSLDHESISDPDEYSEQIRKRAAAAEAVVRRPLVGVLKAPTSRTSTTSPSVTTGSVSTSVNYNAYKNISIPSFDTTDTTTVAASTTEHETAIPKRPFRVRFKSRVRVTSGLFKSHRGHHHHHRCHRPNSKGNSTPSTSSVSAHTKFDQQRKDSGDSEGSFIGGVAKSNVSRFHHNPHGTFLASIDKGKLADPRSISRIYDSSSDDDSDCSTSYLSSSSGSSISLPLLDPEDKEATWGTLGRRLAANKYENDADRQAAEKRQSKRYGSQLRKEYRLGKGTQSPKYGSPDSDYEDEDEVGRDRFHRFYGSTPATSSGSRWKYVSPLEREQSEHSPLLLPPRRPHSPASFYGNDRYGLSSEGSSKCLPTGLGGSKARELRRYEDNWNDIDAAHQVGTTGVERGHLHQKQSDKQLDPEEVDEKYGKWPMRLMNPTVSMPIFIQYEIFIHYYALSIVVLVVSSRTYPMLSMGR